LKNNQRQRFIIVAGEHRLELGRQTLVMGILNVTPDSFSDGGVYFDKDAAVEQCVRMEEKGADIIDIGGESTRPGAEPVSLEEEIDRVCPVSEAASARIGVPISIDTCKPEVAARAIEAGARIINDIFALRQQGMVEVAVEHGLPVILMHMKGTPKDMQKNPVYDDLMGEIIGFLRERIVFAEQNGMSRDSIIIDPGIGFGKTVDHNFEILARLDELRNLNAPVLVGPSRKSFIGKTLNLEIDQRLMGTASACCAAVLKGAHIVRVHDVSEMKQALEIADRICNWNSGHVENNQ